MADNDTPEEVPRAVNARQAGIPQPEPESNTADSCMLQPNPDRDTVTDRTEQNRTEQRRIAPETPYMNQSERGKGVVGVGACVYAACISAC